jgi:DMSO/TMAO reductase YedYZ molybdopterin-dependent catalytic subunit
MTQLALLLTLIIGSAPSAVQPTIEVRLMDGSRQRIALSDLPVRRVPAQEHAQRRVFEGVLLRDVLTKAGVPLGEALRGPALRRYVVAIGQDGYRVVVALPELDEGFTNQSVLIAHGHDGHPLIPDQGPLRLVVPGDRRPARWVRQLIRIEVHEAP